MSSPTSCSDVESFQGKIVYNPDGSAYIIDSENDSLSNLSAENSVLISGELKYSTYKENKSHKNSS